MTLVELIVTFAVAVIFMTAAAMLVVPAAKMTFKVRGMNRVHDDAAIIMETIVNELSYADCYTGESGRAGEQAIQLIEIWDPSDPLYDASYEGYCQKVLYNDKGGNPAVISVAADDDSGGKGRLLITYEAVTEGAETIREKVDWSYGKELYRDNEIKLGFKKKLDENIIIVCLTVTDMTSGGSYTEEMYVRCMNVEASKITEP